MNAKTRGIRNNNPGNIRRSGSNWKGLCPLQKDMSFCQFKEMKWGVRALIYILRTYVTKRNCTSVSKIISRWAPAEDNNNTLLYIKYCATKVGGVLSPKSTEREKEQVGLNYTFKAEDFKLKDGFLSSDILYALVAEICRVECNYKLERGLFEQAMSVL